MSSRSRPGRGAEGDERNVTKEKRRPRKGPTGIPLLTLSLRSRARRGSAQ